MRKAKQTAAADGLQPPLSLDVSDAIGDHDRELGLRGATCRFAGLVRDLIREFQAAGEPLVPFPLSFPNDDFPAFLARLAGCARGEGLPLGFVPHTTYWLVSRGVVVGVSNLRHSLTESLRREGGNIGYGVRPSARRRGFAGEILRRTLTRARDMGMSEVLLTCRKTNILSVRTILGNGGVLASEEFLPERDEVVQRYWIDLLLASRAP